MSGARIRWGILGGGLAGLTCADALLARGHSVVCLEAQAEIGGLARNVVVDQHIFDIGGHRFHSTNSDLLRWVDELMGDEFIVVERKSRILMDGRFSDYPLRPLNALRGVGLGRSIRFVAGYLSAAVDGRGEHDNFEDWVKARFGQPLYDVYFGPYTRKVWGIDPRKISATWAAQRIQIPSLLSAIQSAFMELGSKPRTLVSSFRYPRRGIGRIAARLGDRVRSRGGEILISSPVSGIAPTPDGFDIAYGGPRPGSVRVDRVISTMPVGLTANLLGIKIPPGMLTYRCLRCVMILLNRPRVTDDTWIYTPEEDIVFGRIHEPKNWSRDLAPGDGTSLCLEVFCTEGDERWNMSSEDLHRRCVDDLCRLGFIEAGEVRKTFDIKVRDAYPVFLVGFEKPLSALTGEVLARGVRLVGRTGAFTYKNMDQVMEDALALVEDIERT